MLKNPPVESGKTLYIIPNFVTGIKNMLVSEKNRKLDFFTL